MANQALQQTRRIRSRSSLDGPARIAMLNLSAAGRSLLITACLLLCGCDFLNNKASGPTAEIADVSGQNRLMMRYVQVQQGGYDFDALVWWAQEAGTGSSG